MAMEEHRLILEAVIDQKALHFRARAGWLWATLVPGPGSARSDR